MAFKELKRVGEYEWEIAKDYKQGMNVPARIYGSEEIARQMDEGVYEQISNVAMLPGIQKRAMVMPDGHWGYGFPIGGVAAFDLNEGVISPGGIGFDINCGMRLMLTNLHYDEVKERIKPLVEELFRSVPAGVGGKGKLSLSRDEFNDVLMDGAKWCVNNGYGWEEDLESIEDRGRIEEADYEKVSEKAVSRGIRQIGTLGSGNHYLEIQVVHPEEIFDREIAEQFGIFPGQVAVMVHCGSRGLGHQVGTDYLKSFVRKMDDYNIKVPDRELASLPFNSEEGQDYYRAMAAAANMAFANRQLISHRIRESFSRVLGRSAEEMEIRLLYDVAHNIAKVEKYEIDGKKRKVLVHRKGATRSFPPGHEELAGLYRKTGQPVILGGSMETGSYLLVGAEGAMNESFGSTAHGSGRVMSRSKAKHAFRGETLKKDMEEKGIYVKAVSMGGLAEEAGKAYKDINEVVKSIEGAGLSKRVVALRPVGNVKG